MNKLPSHALLALLIALPTGSSFAAERPLPLYNMSALARAFELPVLGESQILTDGVRSTDLRYDLTTEYHASGNTAEAVTLDGESDLITFAFRRGLGDGLEFTTEVPVLYQGGGFMDSTVEHWHSLLSLPDGGRDNAPRNRYLYEYQKDGQTLLDEHRSGVDLGDIRVGLGWQAADGLALRSELKLASGSESHLAGGNYGGALWADWALPIESSSIFSGWLSGGVAYNGSTDVLHEMQNHWVPLAGVGTAVRAFDHVSLLGQLYYHGALYDGDLKPFREALQLAIGLRYQMAQDFSFDFAFQEDPITTSSPDFSVHLGLSWRS